MTPKTNAPYIMPRATAQPQGIDPSVLRAAQAIAARRSWIPGTGQPQVAPQNPYMANENAPSLRGLSPTGRFNDMRARRQALYANLVPQGQYVDKGVPTPVDASQLADQALDVQSGIGRGTDDSGMPTAVTPLGGRISTSYRPEILPQPATPPRPADPDFNVAMIPGNPEVPASPAATTRTLTSPYGKGSSIDTGTPGQGQFGIPMAGGSTKYVPMSIFRTPQARQLEQTEQAVKNVHGLVDDEGDFQEMMDKLKAANKKT